MDALTPLARELPVSEAFLRNKVAPVLPKEHRRIVAIVAIFGSKEGFVRNPVHRGHWFQRKADSLPVIADTG